MRVFRTLHWCAGSGLLSGGVEVVGAAIVAVEVGAGKVSAGVKAREEAGPLLVL